MQGSAYSIVLPYQKIHPTININQEPVSQFLVGYRNILINRNSQPQWALVKSQNYCGKAFLYSLEQSIALKIQQYRAQGQIFQVVGNTYILLRSEVQIKRFNQPITQNQLLRLLNDLGGVNQININIIKCSFDNFNQYQRQVEGQIQKIRVNYFKKPQQQQKQILNWSKNLSGDSLKTLPKLQLKTGQVQSNQSVSLNL